jgi:hypothetical protein
MKLSFYCFRYLKSQYEITTEEVQKIAVVNIELLDKPYIQEIHFFVLDFESTNATLTNSNCFN